MEVGFDSKDGKKRIIKDVTVPISFYKQHADSGIGLSFIDYEYWQKLESSMTFLGMENDPQTIRNRLDNFIDEPVLFTFCSKLNVSSKTTDILGEETGLDFGELVNNNSSAVNQLLIEISDNEESVKIGNTNGADSSLLILTDVRACFN